MGQQLAHPVMEHKEGWTWLFNYPGAIQSNRKQTKESHPRQGQQCNKSFTQQASPKHWFKSNVDECGISTGQQPLKHQRLHAIRLAKDTQSDSNSPCGLAADLPVLPREVDTQVLHWTPSQWIKPLGSPRRIATMAALGGEISTNHVTQELETFSSHKIKLSRNATVWWWEKTTRFKPYAEVPIPLLVFISNFSENLTSIAAVTFPGKVDCTLRVAWACPAKLSRKNRGSWRLAKAIL